MPIFEYVCPECRHRFESIVYGTQSPACPACKNPRVEKQISGFAVGRTGDPAAGSGGACGTCGDPRGPGACSMN